MCRGTVEEEQVGGGTQGRVGRDRAPSIAFMTSVDNEWFLFFVWATTKPMALVKSAE